MVFYEHARGKVKAVCAEPGCGWSSPRFPDMSGTHLPLAYHNFECHPGVFPRWNPDFKAIEQQKKPSKGVTLDEGVWSEATDPEGGTGETPEGGGQAQAEAVGD